MTWIREALRRYGYVHHSELADSPPTPTVEANCNWRRAQEMEFLRELVRRTNDGRLKWEITGWSTGGAVHACAELPNGTKVSMGRPCDYDQWWLDVLPPGKDAYESRDNIYVFRHQESGDLAIRLWRMGTHCNADHLASAFSGK